MGGCADGKQGERDSNRVVQQRWNDISGVATSLPKPDVDFLFKENRYHRFRLYAIICRPFVAPAAEKGRERRADPEGFDASLVFQE